MASSDPTAGDGDGGRHRGDGARARGAPATPRARRLRVPAVQPAPPAQVLDNVLVGRLAHAPGLRSAPRAGSPPPTSRGRAPRLTRVGLGRASVIGAPTRYPGASSSASPLRAPSSRSRGPSSPTSRCRASTPRSPERDGAAPRHQREDGITVITSLHVLDLAARLRAPDRGAARWPHRARRSAGQPRRGGERAHLRASPQ